MADLTKIELINKVIEDYFTENTALTIAPAKDLMPGFIRAGIFVKDQKSGLPIRKILRELDKNDELGLIPYLYADRSGKDTYWYFIPKGATPPTTPYKKQEKNPETIKKLAERSNKDEKYVIDLCDQVLALKANRQKRFDFLLGDLHKDGKTQTMLPVDAFYLKLNLVVEFLEYYPAPSHNRKNEKQTVSGVSRDEQREIYNRRKAEILPEFGIDLIVIKFSDFKCDDQMKIVRNEEADLEIVRKALKRYLK